jgi:ferredoxin-NADP reductase
MYNYAQTGDTFLLDPFGSGTVAITPRMVMTPIGGPGGIMLIGGGSAVIGLVSIVEELLHDEEGLKIPAIKLFHSIRSNEDIPFYTRMSDLCLSE